MRLFVYGSLKRGFSNHNYLHGQRFLGMARTRPVYLMHDCGGYPGVVIAPPGGGMAVEGELWDIDEECRQRIDWLEDTGVGTYRLTPCVLEADGISGDPNAWIYLYAGPVRNPTRTTGWDREKDVNDPVPYPDDGTPP